MELHYVVTLQWNPGYGVRMYTGSWTVQAPEGFTRSEAVAQALQLAREASQAPADAVVVFLSIERNEL